MSSHHIVRENQEPALIVDSVEDLSDEYIGQLLEWCPTVFVSETTLSYFLLRDIKADFLVQTGSSLQHAQQDMKVIPQKLGVIKDSLDYLCSHNYGAVNIITPMLPDHLEAYCQRINMVFFTNQRRYIQAFDRYEKWAVKGVKIYVDMGSVASIQGLRVIRQDVLETTQEGFYSITPAPGVCVKIGEEI
ncbi:hypothetical protein [Sphingobacterium sp. JB170]|uniref:hypothetical protein n=1 Tax=Sphingobacterium sp. JB170 TaxID=1434842 RepID=UPI00097F2ED2|nr:hypothetical protein [Sphingobacterium sp. JB170]SJN21391.1 hypothetical protein FM107_02810 [Sphingobacterium sp. JB170]